MLIAIYLRCSTDRQTTASQEADLNTYAQAEEAKGNTVEWHRDKATGSNFDRPGWERLYSRIQSGKVNRVVVWRLDRLGRLAGATISLLDELEKHGVGFVSVKDGFDASTPAGRLTRNVLASVAQFETEVRRERQRAGIDAARAAGRKVGGGKAGRIVRLTAERRGAVISLKAAGKGITEISKVVGLSRPTVYKVLSNQEQP